MVFCQMVPDHWDSSVGSLNNAMVLDMRPMVVRGTVRGWRTRRPKVHEISIALVDPKPEVCVYSPQTRATEFVDTFFHKHGDGIDVRYLSRAQS